MKWEKCLQSRTFWIIFVFILFYCSQAFIVPIIKMVQSPDQTINAREYFSEPTTYTLGISLLPASLSFFSSGLLYWLDPSKDKIYLYNWWVIWVLSFLLLASFVLFLVKIRKIKKQWLLRIFIALIIVAIFTIAGCSQIDWRIE